MKTKLRTAFTATILVTLWVGAPLYAQTPDESDPYSPNEVVHYRDADLSTSSGVQTLYSHILGAAQRVCEQTITGPSGIERVRCKQALVELTVNQINKAPLTALHRGKLPNDLTAGR